MKFFLFTPILLFILLSCQSGKKPQEVKDTARTLPKLDTNVRDIPQDGGSAIDLTAIPEKSLPYTDSTNFDNFNNDGISNPALISAIKFEGEFENVQDVRIRYKLNFSDDITGLVVTYPIGEHELNTTLLLLNKELKLVDQMDIAYDEIAESAIREISLIEKEKLSIEHWNYFSDEPTVEKKVYQIRQDGKLQAIKN
ncbi:hypothetical protein [Sphingobacterium sp. BN32]|uniref:hypothetical protein n=1 Tax=Sphingobacterium sp. BN32 TaxID=3058432 RepID=UPI00265C9F3E|nr:hypothetical protein [Sphingobacterium sp. BN32]WKK57140.1 hypothetical protein QYC40_10825 [Sphingobacterium sp. BN32]